MRARPSICSWRLFRRFHSATNRSPPRSQAFTLELFPDDTRPAILGEVRRTLRAGGRLAVVSMDVGTVEQRRAAPERIYTWMHRHFPHIVDCRPIDVEQRLGEAGFTIERIERLEIWGLPVVACLAQ
jgi:demethylmenaquinone methyltransferase/2-methoxy-6-polyprenyl-1,4-benzoquinol methylase